MILPITATKGLKKKLETIPGKHPTDILNKKATLETSHTLWKVLQTETEAQAVGITISSREVPGKEGLSQEK